MQKYLPENYNENRSRIYKGIQYGGINSSSVFYGTNDGGPDGLGYNSENAMTMVEVSFNIMNISGVWNKEAKNNKLDLADPLTGHYSFMSIINNLKFVILPYENVMYSFDYVFMGDYDPENDILNDCRAYKIFKDSSMFIQSKYAFIFQKNESDYFDGFNMTFLDFDDSGLDVNNEVFNSYYVLKEQLERHGYSAVVLNNYNLSLKNQNEIVIRTDKPYFDVLTEVRGGIYDYPDNKQNMEKTNDIASILCQLGVTDYITREFNAIAERDYLFNIREVELLLTLIKMEDEGILLDFDVLRNACRSGKSTKLNEIAAMLRVIETNNNRLRYYNFSCLYYQDMVTNASDEIKKALMETPFIAMMRASKPSREIIVDRNTFRPNDPLPGGYLLSKSINGLPDGLKPPAAYYNDRYEALSTDLFGVCDPDNISVYIDEEYSVSFIGNYELSGRNKKSVAVYGVTTVVTVSDAINGDVLFKKQLGEPGKVPSTFFVPNTFDEVAFFHTSSVQEKTIEEILNVLNLK